MIYSILAHAGESHATTAEATAHELAWYLQLILFFLCTAGFAAIIYVVTKKKDTTLLLTASVLLIAGFALFRISPIVSATAITIGLLSTLFVTLVGLGEESKHPNHKK